MRKNIFLYADSIIVVTSLFYEKFTYAKDDDFFKYKDSYRIRVNNIVSGDGFKKFVKIYPYSKIDLYDESENINFRTIKDLTWSEIFDFLFLWFDNDFLIHGHIFLVLENLGLIVYPHCDDFGFGFIHGSWECENESLRRKIPDFNVAKGFKWLTKLEYDLQ